MQDTEDVALNRQRFLAELARLLVFMTESDRELTVADYAAQFDEVGEAGEADLIKSLGSPTKVAISLSRGYTPGQITTENRHREALQKAERATMTVRSEMDGIEDFVPGGSEENDDPVRAILRSLDESDAEAERQEREWGTRPAAEPSEPSVWDFPEEEEEPAYIRASSTFSRGTGTALLALVLLIVGVPLALATLVVLAVWLVPGVGGFLGAWLCAVGALWTLSYMADALVLLGLGFFSLAAGLLLLWLGIWLDVTLVRLFIRGVQLLFDLFLGKKVAVE